ncbi:fibronectin type III domain-containing protein [Cytophagales bacterium LB-30]|uniref:Fibronectin type III domain-containing protein n=1 Tax=Shiella aurantiaca TaxID=3058365 RepID=A0ABT8F0L0_9BACT|nr:fibronectin type III domain-containing protein [Shiella aurantiaca]MDN4163879.1 fibronectin type III domain-containing protein [Shiella aurantiaca]
MNLNQAYIHILKAFLVAALFLCTLAAKGQQFPVQVNTYLSPPYTLYFSDYASAGSDKLSALLLLRETNRLEYQVRLRLRIEGPGGIVIQSKSTLLPPPLVLQGGIPYRLSGEDLAPYFNLVNLEVQGISQSALQSRGRLPEGVYTFCLEVLDYTRGVVVSNRGCATAWLMLNSPPMLTQPFDGLKLNPQEPQNIVFQWTPRHTASPNAAFQVSYKIQVVELWPEGRNPNDAFNTLMPVAEAEVQSPYWLMGPAETPLIHGRKYAWRVQALDQSGLDLFENEGRSPVYTFTYGDACQLPENLKAEALDAASFKVSWTSKPFHSTFEVQFRTKQEDAEWFTIQTTTSEVEIVDLTPGTTYQYRLKASCGVASTLYSEVGEVSTLGLNMAVFECGADLTPETIDPNTLMPSLEKGDIITAGSFQIKLTKISGGDGKFSGEGLAVVPMMNNMKVRTVFSEVYINDQKQLIIGRIDVTGAVVQLVDDATRAEIMETLDELGTGLGTIESFLDAAGQVDDIINDIGAFADDAPEEVKKMLEQGKEMISQGRELLSSGNAGDALKGQDLIRQGIDTIKEGVKELDKVLDALEQAADGLKDIVASLLNEIKTSYAQIAQNKNDTLTLAERGLGNRSYFINQAENVVIEGEKGDVSQITTLDVTSAPAMEVDAEALKNYFNKANTIYAQYLSLVDTYNSYKDQIVVMQAKLEHVQNLLTDTQLSELTNQIKSEFKEITGVAITQITSGNSIEDIKSKLKKDIEERINRFVNETINHEN